LSPRVEECGRASNPSPDFGGLTDLESSYSHLVIELKGYRLPTTNRLDTTFAALADPTRRAILARLALGETTVGELAAPFAMSQPAISKQLKVLERAGLISRGRDAQRRPCKVEAAPLAEATDWLERYRRTLEANFGRLDALVDEMKSIETEVMKGKRQ